MTRRSPFRVSVALTAASAALLTLSGCVTVHGEREKIPAVSKADADTALQRFIDGYNEANRELDPKLVASYETGAAHAIDEAVVKAGHAIRPQGNTRYNPLTLTNVTYIVPKQPRWPKFFVADAISNRAGGRWFLAFTRNGLDAPWKAAYLSVLTDDEIPRFKTDKEGYAETVPLDGATGLKVAPGALGAEYAKYLNTGRGDLFADGQHTNRWRDKRAQTAEAPGRHIQTVDEPSTYPAMALRTEDGGALVFFATKYYQRKTVSRGATIPIPPEIGAVMDGPAKKTDQMTFTTVSEQAVKVPAKGSTERVVFLNRIEAKTAAKAE